MNSKKIFNVFLPILLFLVVLLPAACAKKSGIQLAEKTTTSMQDVNTDMELASAQIDATQASLEKVINVGQSPTSQPGEVKQAYNAFSENVDKMDENTARLNKHIDEMNARGNEYFEEWSEAGGTYINPEIQQLSQDRRVKLQRSFTDIAAASAGMRGTLNSYLSELEQIDSFLSNDLTARGVSAIVPIAEAAQRDGNSLKNSFQPVQNAIEEARLQMMPGGAAAGGVSDTSEDKSGAGDASDTSEGMPGPGDASGASEDMSGSGQQ